MANIIPLAAIKEILCLLVHTDQGCLSGILPGRGTNRNERLHKDMNSHMKNNRYGVELAYYATSTLFTMKKSGQNLRTGVLYLLIKFHQLSMKILSYLVCVKIVVQEILILNHTRECQIKVQ